MVKSLIGGASVLAVALGLAFSPLLADDTKKDTNPGQPPATHKDGGFGKDAKDAKCGCEEVVLDRPIAEVVGRIPELLKKNGLFQLADIDWAKYAGGKTDFPGTNRIDKFANVHTILFASEKCVQEIMDQPASGLWGPARFVVYDKGGKATLIYMKPTQFMNTLKEKGLLDNEKYEKKIGFVREFEKKLDAFVNDIRGTKSS